MSNHLLSYVGIRFGKTIKYPFYSSYTKLDDKRRLKRPLNIINHSVMYNIKTNVLPKPIKFTYNQYVTNARLVNEKKKEPKECGINGLWILHDLPYSNLIYKTKDIMHTAYNIIKDTIRLIKPNGYHTQMKNRTKEKSVLDSCKEHQIFTFMTSDQPSWPWIMDNNSAKEHDNRLKNVLGIELYCYKFQIFHIGLLLFTVNSLHITVILLHFAINLL